MMTSLPELTFQTSPDIEGTPNQKHPSVLVGGSTVVLCWWPQNCKTCMETGCFHGPVPQFYVQLSQVGLTEKLKGDKRKFELWSKGREEVVIIQAPTMEVKEVWVKEIKRVLMNQFDQIKSE